MTTSDEEHTQNRIDERNIWSCLVEIMILNTCPKAWILKFLHSKEWGDAYSMLGLIAHMWKIKITLINYLEYDAEFVTYGPYCGRECHADIYIIYNGWSHYTATGTN